MLNSSGGYQTVQDAPYNTPLGVAFLEAALEMGYDVRDVNGEKQTGFAFYQYTMRRGSRCSTAKAFLRPVRLRPNLHVSMFSHVTQILIEPGAKKRAYGVEFIRDGKKHVVKARKEVGILLTILKKNVFISLKLFFRLFSQLVLLTPRNCYSSAE